MLYFGGYVYNLGVSIRPSPLRQMLDKQSLTQCPLKAAEVGWAPWGVFLARRAYKSKKTKQTMTDITGMQAAALALTLQFFLVWFNPV